MAMRVAIPCMVIPRAAIPHMVESITHGFFMHAFYTSRSMTI